MQPSSFSFGVGAGAEAGVGVAAVAVADVAAAWSVAQLFSTFYTHVDVCRSFLMPDQTSLEFRSRHPHNLEAVQ